MLTLAVYQTDKPQYKFFDAQTETLFKKLTAKLPGYDLALQGRTAMRTSSSSPPTTTARRARDTCTTPPRTHWSKLADLNPSLPESGMARVQPISYQSRDGLTIHGYLTLPAGRDPKNLACIVNPHGGPWARDGWGYNPEVQFLANRGFCVLQMNFRGSTGYGRRFWEAGFGQWGLKMQDDISDGVAWLVKQGIADPKRVGIYGASYGGYATLAGVTFTPDLYAAAVDYVGVSNLFTFMQTIPPYWKPMLAKMQDMVGDPCATRTAWPRPRRRCTRTASRRRCSWPRAPGSARQQGRKRPDGQGAEGARRQRGVHGQGQRGPRLPQRREQVRVLRGHGEVPAPAPQAVVAFDPAGLAATAALAASAPPCAVQSQVAAAPKPTEPPVSTRSRPSSLARYNATSARARMPSAVSPRR